MNCKKGKYEGKIGLRLQVSIAKHKTISNPSIMLSLHGNYFYFGTRGARSMMLN
jgi:hypothetical protein